MKKLKFTCSNCQAKLRVPTHLAGVSAPCPKCGEIITAPADVTLAEEESIEPAHAGVSSNQAGRRDSVHAPAARGHAGESATQQVASPPEAPIPPEPEEEEVERRSTYGQNIPVPIPPAPVSESVAPSVENDERAVSEEPPLDHTVEAPASLDDIAIQAPSSPAVETPPPPAAAAPPVDQAPPIPAEQPLVEKTQPIKVNAQPRNLPEARAEAVSENADLPRLDVSLGGQDVSASEMLSPDGIPAKEPTKVHLSGLGDQNQQLAPDDFIVSRNVPQPAAEAPPEMPSPDDLTDFSAEQFGETVAPEEVDSSPSQHESSGDTSVSELLGLDGFEADLNPTARSGSQPGGEPPAAATPEVEIPAIPPLDPPPLEQAPDPDEAPLPPEKEMAFVALEAEAPVSSLSPGVEETPEVPVEQLSHDPGQVQVQEQVPGPNPIAASAGSAPAQLQSPPPAKSEADVLDDMFGGNESGGNFSFNLKLVIIAGAAILATVAVILFGNAMGGWSVSDPTVSDASIKPAVPETGSDPETPDDQVLPPVTPVEPSIDDAPAVIDPVAMSPVEGVASNERGSTVSLPGDTSSPVRIMDSSGNLRDPVAEAAESIKSAQDSAGETLDKVTETAESAALSFDEKVQSIVNGSQAGGGGSGMSVIGGAGPATNAESGNGSASGFPEVATSDGEAAATVEEGAEPGTAKNYNPEPFYAAPATDDPSPLGKTHELIDAFLRAPDWETRLRYTYQGDSLKPSIQQYYQKWEDRPIERFSLQLFQMETDPEMGGPYWVYLISTSDVDQGFPLIVRVEDGNLKVDWEIFSEFYDRHFVRFRSGETPGPATFRLVIERMSDYYGADRDGFTDLDDYFVYQINPPYGDLNEFSEYAFVKKDSDLAKSLDAVVGLGEEPLAVIITLDKSSFAHGIKHLVITEYVTEGWFR